MVTYRDYVDYRGGRAHTVVGTLKVLEGVLSPQLGNGRDIFVYLPPSYASGLQRYPVIYMHDGQNLFDAETSFAGEWQVDETLETSSYSGVEAIVVGIPNAGEHRCDEYSPFRMAAAVGAKSTGQGSHYVSFIADTLKPHIDREFRTLTERTYTGIMGSSMGGLISLYGFFHRPQTFGFAGVMSPSVWCAGRAILDYVRRSPCLPGAIYLDVGTAEGTETLEDARELKTILTDKGYQPGRELLFVEDRGAGHYEAAWARRLGPAIRYLLLSRRQFQRRAVEARRSVPARSRVAAGVRF